ncbi:hypothetical protein AVEN_112142-1 [Araneus ventricosus]|uniref:Uncharacterized protein n=1 Tax=Araneus ventricosus TaxID=182803 RepID=A0A4Y2XA91_ARAVE|nr:hypothetical protein AVEN_237187-1 [Araneus ventricosus]GBO46080.1 hypothetical protein AVEN_244082-1 [Araneus ventricosus]GBO46081.1 hypothetical protein AVEN_87123-1 [Araneus ventricosus]GBO46082.1 hypothetical protein AVEN_112142-1 [Araneus ventricosus]
MKSTHTRAKNDVIGSLRSEPIILSDFLPQFYQGRVCKYATGSEWVELRHTNGWTFGPRRIWRAPDPLTRWFFGGIRFRTWNPPPPRSGPYHQATLTCIPDGNSNAIFKKMPMCSGVTEFLNSKVLHLRARLLMKKSDIANTAT